eukprot:TRINITY_DN49081_c0_g1_i1.p1 TRINITY_DN49081_c0_g1~~TRINITY_DN49081_c0_g1_i1.p1  ORF type:complete len:422 (+),score=63.58 TRINITY_DN49081_c0_g1_i1:19-1284(+)
MLVLLTGATGLVGQTILRDLISHRIHVRCLVRTPAKMEAQLADLTNTVRAFVEIVPGDVLDLNSVINSMQDVDIIVHSAALLKFEHKYTHAMQQINIEGAKNMLEAAWGSGNNSPRLFIFIGALAAHIGWPTDGTSGPVTEDTPINSIVNQLNVYSQTKALASQVMQNFARTYNAPIVELIPPAVIGAPPCGAGDVSHWADGSPAMFHEVAKGMPVYIPGRTPCVAVKDIALAVRLLCNHCDELKLNCGEKFFLISDTLPNKEFYARLAESVNKKPPRWAAPNFVLKMFAFGQELIFPLMNKSPSLTRDALKMFTTPFPDFDASKITNTLPAFKYSQMDKVISQTGAQYLADTGKGTVKKNSKQQQQHDGEESSFSFSDEMAVVAITLVTLALLLRWYQDHLYISDWWEWLWDWLAPQMDA